MFSSSALLKLQSIEAFTEYNSTSLSEENWNRAMFLSLGTCITMHIVKFFVEPGVSLHW